MDSDAKSNEEMKSNSSNKSMSIDSKKKDEQNPLDDNDKVMSGSSANEDNDNDKPISDSIANEDNENDANISIFDQENIEQGNIPTNILTSHGDKSFNPSYEKKGNREASIMNQKKKSNMNRNARSHMENVYKSKHKDGISVEKYKYQAN
jgi:hypothetical protein